MNTESFSIIVLIIRIVNYLKRRFIIFLISIIIGIIIALFQYYTKPVYYITSFEIDNNSISKYDISQDIESFKAQYFNDTSLYYSNLYKIDNEKFKSIKSIDIDTNSNIKLTIISYDLEFAKSFPHKYYDYLNNCESINDKFIIQKNRLEEYLAKIDKKLDIIDSLQEYSSNSIPQNKDLQNNSIFNDYLLLYEKKIELENKIDNMSKAIISSNNIIVKNGKKSLQLTIIQFTLLCLFIGFVVSIFLEIRRMIKKYNNT